MKRFGSFSGIIASITDFSSGNEQAGCNKQMTITDRNGDTVDFIVSPVTYFLNSAMMKEGDQAIGFYDSTVPVPLIYPPRYQAVVMARTTRYQNVTVDFFDSQLTNSEGTLKLNVSPFTRIILENGQAFSGSLANRYLIVVYGPTTRSIPAQTTPFEIVVMCRIT